MRKLALLVSLLALLPSIAPASGLLWRVDGGRAPLYLVGSVHVLPPSAQPFDQKFDIAYAESQVLLFETDIDAISAPETQRKLVSAGVYPTGQTIQNRWPGWLLKEFTEAAEELKLPVEMFYSSKPWLAALSLEMDAYVRQGYDPRYGVDQYFWKRAKGDKKKLITLETAKTQLSIFTDMPDATSENYLAATLENLNELDYDPAELLEIWTDGDSGELVDVLDELGDVHPDVYRRLISSRNNFWMPTVLDQLDQGRAAMVVVGALHIPGPDGLIAQLKKKGYKIKKL